jgi:ribose transport system permease protein
MMRVAPGPRRRAGSLSRYGHQVALLGVLVASAFIFAVTDRDFPTAQNLGNILLQVSIILIVSAGMTVAIVAGEIDLSVGAVAALASVISIDLLLYGSVPVPVALIAGVALGLGVGLVNGLVTSLLNVPGFVTTLAMMTTARGVAFIASGGSPVRSSDVTLGFLYNGDLGPLPTPVIIAALVCTSTYLFLAHTAMGRAFYATGGRRDAAEVNGIDVRRVAILAYVFSGATAGLGGLLAASRSASGDAAITGQGWELQAVAIVVLGGANLFGGSGGIVGTAIAAVFIGVINNWMSLAGLDWWLQGLVLGALLVGVVALGQKRNALALATRRSGNRSAIRAGNPP